MTDEARPVAVQVAVGRPAAIPDHFRGGVVAIGNFDGVHRGHQALLGAAIDASSSVGGPPVALTFEPHPRAVLEPDSAAFRLTPEKAKLSLIRAVGIDRIVVAAFDPALAGVRADAFVELVLVGWLKARGVVVGYDFRFGAGRAGDRALLGAAGARHGFRLTVVDPVLDDRRQPFASGRARRALAAGEIDVANDILGYRWFVEGRVVTGDRRGRELGFPTANLMLDAPIDLRHGIYAVTLRRSSGSPLPAVASFGRRPTFGGGDALLEVHVFDFAGDLYGEPVKVTFLSWLRAEERFASAEALIDQMHRDVDAALAVHAVAGPGTSLDQALAATS